MKRKTSKRLYIEQHTYKGTVLRDARIDNARGILIMLVVIGHFLLLMQGSSLVASLVHFIYIFHMPAFIMLSGFMAKGVCTKRKFRWGKIIQLLWLYLVFELVVWVTEGINYGFEFLPSFIIHETGAPWFLLALSVFYLTTPLLRPFSKSGFRFPIVFILMTVGLVIKYFFNPGSLFSLDRIISFYPFFVLGYFFDQGDLDSYLVSKEKKYIELLALIFLIIVLIKAGSWEKYSLVMYGADFNRYDVDVESSVWIFNYIWYAVSIIISIAFVGIVLNRKMWGFTTLGRNSLQIYFLHRPIRDIMEFCGFFNAFNNRSIISMAFLIAFSVILTLFLGSNTITIIFDKLRGIFDPLLAKRGAL